MNNNTLEENQKIIDDYINKNNKSYNAESMEIESKVKIKEQKVIEMLKDRVFTLEDKVCKLESIIVGLQTGYYSNTKSQENEKSRESLIKAIDDFYENSSKGDNASMTIAEATNLGIIPEDLHSVVVDTYINHGCHICKSHEVDVYPMYGEGIIEFKCRKCGASRGTMNYF